MTRFFIPSSQIKGKTAVLNGSDFHHVLNVLRKQVGDEIHILNGQGGEYSAIIKEIRPDEVVAEIQIQMEKSTESRVKINLIQGLPKADKFEWIIQKNTELGISSFQPVLTERTAIRLDSGSRLKKKERWETIIKTAAEQSGRQVIPKLEMTLDWTKVLAQLEPGLTLIPWESEEECSLKDVLDKQKRIPETINLFIGPEGGFSLKEVKDVRGRGGIPVSLGPRILRTETAGLVAGAAILYHFGELG